MNRLEYIDFAKGVGIILMVIGHVNKTVFINDIIYSFHMPLFLILSGMFLKPEKFDKETVYKWFRQLAPYYFVTALIITIINVLSSDAGWYYTIVECLKCTFLGRCNFGPIKYDSIGMVWFLYTLFICRILACATIRWKRYLLVPLLCASLIAMYLMNTRWMLAPFYLSASVVASLFLIIGYYLRKHVIDRIRNYGMGGHFLLY